MATQDIIKNKKIYFLNIFFEKRILKSPVNEVNN